MSLAWYLILVGVLFAIGTATIFVCRSAVIVLTGAEMMLNTVNLILMTFTRTSSNIDDEITAFFVMVVAAAEVVVDLSIIVSIYRLRPITSMNDLNLLKN